MELRGVAYLLLGCRVAANVVKAAPAGVAGAVKDDIGGEYGGVKDALKKSGEDEEDVSCLARHLW